jgi:hypothetical protein
MLFLLFGIENGVPRRKGRGTEMVFAHANRLIALALFLDIELELFADRALFVAPFFLSPFAAGVAAVVSGFESAGFLAVPGVSLSFTIE